MNGSLFPFVRPFKGLRWWLVGRGFNDWLHLGPFCVPIPRRFR